MDKLNHECLEHIFGFFNGPKEWLILSKVCNKWQDVISRFWRRIDRISIDDIYHEYNPRGPYLSTKMVTAILVFAAQHVREITITKHKKINNIKLGNQTYNLSGLNMNAFLESFAKYSYGQLLKAAVLPDDQEFLEFLMNSNENLRELNLRLTKDSFAQMKYWPKYCVNLRKKIFESFPKLERLTVTFAETSAIIRGNLNMVDEIMSSLSERSTPKELQVEIPYGSFLDGEVVSFMNRYCSKKIRLPNDFSFRSHIVGNLIITLSNSSQRFFDITVVTVQFKHVRLFEESHSHGNWTLFNEVIPSLQELKLLVDSTWQTRWRIGEKTDLRCFLLYAVNLTILHNRTVVINESMQIVKNDKDQHVNTQPLYITISPTEERTEEVRNFLEQKFADCIITAKL